MKTVVYSNIKTAYSVEKAKLKNRYLFLICLLTPLLSLLLTYLSSDAYGNVGNMLQGISYINDFLVANVMTYIGLVQPLYLVLVCYVVFTYIEEGNNSILYNSIVPKYCINYSKILLIIKYNIYNILFLILYCFILLLYISVNSPIKFNINYSLLPRTFLVLLLLPTLSLPLIAFLNILSKWISSFYISLLIILPAMYFVNYKIILLYDVTIFSYFNFQLVFLQTLEPTFPINRLELSWIIITNVILSIMFLFFIRYYSYRRF